MKAKSMSKRYQVVTVINSLATGTKEVKRGYATRQEAFEALATRRQRDGMNRYSFIVDTQEAA
jgi:hypothetical protein